MAIENYYKALTITRTTIVEWGANTTVVTNGTGYIQPVSGNSTFQDGKNGERVSHRLYTSVDSDIIYGDEILQDGVKYKAIFTDQVGGITNRLHHKEVLLERFA